jgi:hypothetical protein
MDCDDIQVYDEAFTRNDAFKMAKVMTRIKKSEQNSHGYFTRDGRDPINPIEGLINDILDKFGDTSNMVEYWFRCSWFDMKCHQDLNEGLLADEDIVINPNHGHILYISDLNDEAATLLFNREFDKVSVVHPKIGRLVRFHGKIFHYVPSPFTSIFGDNSPPHIGKSRYVLLFNTWDHYKASAKDKSPIMKREVLLKTNQFDRWKKLSVYQTIPLRDNNFQMRIKYMGDSIRRFNRNQTEFYYVDEKLKTDRSSTRLIEYEISPVCGSTYSTRNNASTDTETVEDVGCQV